MTYTSKLNSMVPLPARIYKHWIGFVAIFLAAVCVIGLLWVGLGSWMETPGVNRSLVFQIALIAFIAIVVTASIAMYVYGLSYLELTTAGGTIKNYLTPFAPKSEQFEWVKVSRSTGTKAGLFGTIFNYGTVSVETEGGSIQAKITFMPNPEYWQTQLQQLANQATPNA